MYLGGSLSVGLIEVDLFAASKVDVYFFYKTGLLSTFSSETFEVFAVTGTDEGAVFREVGGSDT